MSRLDWFTIAVVGICIAAIIFLLSKAMNWGEIEATGEDVKTELENDLADIGLSDDETIDPDNLDADGEMSGDDVGQASDETGTEGSDVIGDDSSAAGDDATSDFSETDDDAGLADDTPVNTSPSASEEGEYRVIAGSFSLMHNAENFVAKLHKKGYTDAKVAKFNSGRFASVIVDSYNSSSDASALVKELKTEGIDSYVQRKRGNQ